MCVKEDRDCNKVQSTEVEREKLVEIEVGLFCRFRYTVFSEFLGRSWVRRAVPS